MTHLANLKISTRLIAEEAIKRGWDVQIVAEGYNYLLIKHPNLKRPILTESTLNDMTSYVSGRLCDNKWLFHCLLTNANIPVAETIRVSYDDPNLQAEVQEFIDSYRTVVIKPIDSNHGEGVTLGITSWYQAKAAIQLTKKSTQEDAFLLQRQYKGRDFRFLVVGGKCIAVAGRKPAFVIGDGEKTIQELIREKNQQPDRAENHRAALTTIDIKQVEEYLGIARLSSIPHAGEEIQVVAVANLSQGGEAIDITDKTHSELKELACRVAGEVHAGVCGVDIITEEPSQSIDLGNARVLEANKSPGIRMHHFPSEGQSHNVAAIILDELVTHLKASGK